MEELMAKYLANELSEKERADFEVQLVENETIRDDFENYLELWNETAQADEVSFDTNQAWDRMSKNTTQKTRVVRIERKPRYTFLKIAATLLIVLTAGYFLSGPDESFNNLVGISSLNELSTGAEMKEFQLPDGTALKLNANSRVSYEKGFGSEHRNITLVGGANFDVTRNEEIPFIIKAEASEVEVLGTSFDVSAYPGEDIELNVSEGQVKFSSTIDESHTELVQAGEKAMLSGDGTEMEHGTVENLNYAAWWTRELVFEDTPFDQVVKDLEKTYWVKIEYSEALKTCPLGGIYTNITLESMLRKIQNTFSEADIKFTFTEENQVKIEGKSCN